MAIYFNEKLKQLRKARDLTQEQLSSTFNVSPQTISRWETGVNLPDIEMLPSLAAFFKVTIDDLLGVDIVQRRVKTAQFREAIHEKYRENAFEEAIEIARCAVAQLPNDYSMLSWLAMALTRKAFEMPEMEKEKCLREVIAIYKRIIEECPDVPGDCTKANSFQQLAHAYSAIGDKEKAMEYAKGLPYYTAEVLRWVILEGEEKRRKAVENIAIFAYLILEHVESLEPSEGIHVSADDSFPLRESIAIYRTTVEKLEKYIESA